MKLPGGCRRRERVGAPQQLRELESRRGAEHARRRGDRHSRRDEIDDGQLLAEDALHVSESPLTLREIAGLRLLLHQLVDPFLPFRSWHPLAGIPDMVVT